MIYASEVRQDLVIVIVLLKLGFKIVFEKDSVKVLLDSIYYVSSFMLDGFIVLDTISVNPNTSTFVIGSFSNESLAHNVKWHARLSHIRKNQLKRLAKANLLGSIEKIDFPIYEQCLIGKAIRLSFGKVKRAIFLLQLIHSDICDPMNVRTRDVTHYFILL